MALLRRLNLIDAGGEARLWAALRAKHVRLGDLLVRCGAIDHKTLQKALAAIEAASARLGEYLLGQRQLDDATLQAALARQGTPQVLDTAIELGMIGEDEVEAFKARAPEPA